jgi:hypothetical protein
LSIEPSAVSEIAAVPDDRVPGSQVSAGPSLKIGEKTHDDLKGQPIEFRNSQGLSRLLLFWNPACGNCSAMLGDLKTWGANRPPHHPRLLLISAHSVEENEAMGLRSQITLDQDFSVGQMFAGASNVLALAATVAVRSA